MIKMKSTKFYSLDECSDQEKVLNKLDFLFCERKIDYDQMDGDIIRVKDLSLTKKEIKELEQFFIENDVIEDKDFEDEDDFEEEDDYEDDEY